VLDVSYQSIPYSQLQEYLGGSDKEETDTLVKECGWSLSEEGEEPVVMIRNQEANIRPKKILAKIEFESKHG
jgi:hypothetical protein